RVPSFERIKEVIGWVPRTDLGEALEIIIESLG
ncbi:unnamed protein product, partial [marine sediment metagenome]